MSSREDLVWFAGIFDGEGCVSMLRVKRSAVSTSLWFGLSDRSIVDEAARIVASLLGSELPTVYEREPNGGLTRRKAWGFRVAAHQQVYDLGSKLRPLLRVKKLELELVLSVVTRAIRSSGGARPRYVATPLDFEMVSLCSKIKKGDEKAKARATALLREHPPAESAAELVNDEHERWRDWFRRGVPAGAIARHVGATHHLIERVVDGIEQVGNETARSLDLVPKPHWPKTTPETEVNEWRAAVARGESARQVALRYGQKPQYVQNATCDIRWYRETEG